MIDRFGPGVGHLNYLAVPGVGIFEFLFVAVTTNHFPGGEFQLCLTSHFCPGGGEFDSNFFGKCQNPALCPASDLSIAPKTDGNFGFASQSRVSTKKEVKVSGYIEKIAACIHLRV